MLKDFEMITREFPKNEDIHIVPVSDVHIGAAEHMQRRWELFCQGILERPNFFRLGGACVLQGCRRLLQRGGAKKWDRKQRLTGIASAVNTTAQFGTACATATTYSRSASAGHVLPEKTAQ